MSISIYIEPITKADELIQFLLKEEFEISDKTADLLYRQRIKKHFGQLKDTLFLLAETDYIDRVYRDSYYHYYSSKLASYHRNCVRISLFSEKIEPEDFRNEASFAKLKNSYLGFLVMRPSEPFIIGRSVISPKALKVTDFNCCTTLFPCTVNSVKLSVEGFPHSSQDTETISCAETTLWAIMEYFSHRYADYRPIFPSRIIQTLNKISYERQIPTKGLNIQQMSYALKEFGFGTRIYDREEYGEFEQLLSCYVESGLPIVIAMGNRPVGNIGHALLCVGHERIKPAAIDAVTFHPIVNKVLRDTAAKNNITFYDYDSVNKQFMFVDDNHPVYQKAYLAAPAAHYDANWHNCTISHFLVPLYPKIYLEAFEAKNFIARFLIIGPEPLANDTEVMQRTYLASSRSYKDKLAFNNSFSPDLRDIILEMSMPKFIWVAELSTKGLMKEKKANGLVILDATEANTSYNKPLIIAAYQGKVINFEAHSGDLINKNLPLNDFVIFENNLQLF